MKNLDDLLTACVTCLDVASEVLYTSRRIYGAEIKELKENLTRFKNAILKMKHNDELERAIFSGLTKDLPLNCHVSHLGLMAIVKTLREVFERYSN